MWRGRRGRERKGKKGEEKKREGEKLRLANWQIPNVG
jgi:hypothetical protein